eukprot:Ihof_evm14s1 gene=Ihof_evmTU14s1
MSISNFMNLKSFHPGNFHNQRKVWIAEQQAEADEKRRISLEQERKAEQSEIDLRPRLLVEERTGGKGHGGKPEQPSLEEKFKFLKDAPREGGYTQGIATIKDKPFGVEVRNVRCRKCGHWGHQSTDRVCEKYNQGGTFDVADGEEIQRPAYHDPAELMKRMREEQGLALRRTALGRRNDVLANNQQLVLSSDEEQPMEVEDTELAYLKSLSSKEKKKLLKRLSKLDDSKSRKKKKQRSHKRHKHDSSSDSDSC